MDGTRAGHWERFGLLVCLCVCVLLCVLLCKDLLSSAYSSGTHMLKYCKERREPFFGTERKNNEKVYRDLIWFNLIQFMDELENECLFRSRAYRESWIVKCAAFSPFSTLFLYLYPFFFFSHSAGFLLPFPFTSPTIQLTRRKKGFRQNIPWNIHIYPLVEKTWMSVIG